MQNLSRNISVFCVHVYVSLCTYMLHPLGQWPCFLSMQQLMQIKPEGPYQLAGYSFGCCVAFEMALQLQKAFPQDPNIVEQLFMLDGSHQFVNAHTTSYRKKFSCQEGPEVETEVLCAFINQFMFTSYIPVSF